MTRSELINHFIKRHKYKTYLEIGVNTPAQPGYNYDSVEVSVKHGVDPAVDTTYRMTSDDFFTNHISSKYDIIFVDGLHIFEQAYRDIMNSLLWLNDNGTIIVHDCNPVKEITQRQERASDVWHGDVWKAILKLRFEVPDVIIYTVDTDEGCTVIRKGKQKNLDSPGSKIDPYTYDYFHKNRTKILNLISVRKFLRTYPEPNDL